MKRLYSFLSASLCAFLFGLSAPVFSFELTGGSTAFTSDYVFRGISQTDEQIAVQSGLDFDLGGGAYLGLWASNVDFADGADQLVTVTEASVSTPASVSVSTGPSLELDIVLGISFPLGESGITADAGVIFYEYPGGNADEDYAEAYFSAGADNWTVGLNYSNDYFGGNDAYFYVYGDYTAALTEKINLNLHVGWNSFDDEESFDSFFGSADNSEDTYTDWSVSVSQEFQGLEFDLRYQDTDIDSDICEAWCEGRVVFTVSKSF